LKQKKLLKRQESTLPLPPHPKNEAARNPNHASRIVEKNQAKIETGIAIGIDKEIGIERRDANVKNGRNLTVETNLITLNLDTKIEMKGGDLRHTGIKIAIGTEKKNAIAIARNQITNLIDTDRVRTKTETENQVIERRIKA
jgi:hypothetical protein